MQKNNFKQDQKSPASNQSLKNQEIKGAGAETYPTGKAVKGGVDVKQAEQAQRNATTPRGSLDDKAQAQQPLKEGQRFQQPEQQIGGRQDLAQGAQDAQMKTGRTSDVESADFADQDDVDQDDSTKSFAADSKSRGSKLDDVQSQPSTRGSQNSRH